MADLGRSDAQWKRFQREKMLFLGLERVLSEFEARCSRERLQVLNERDAKNTAEQVAAVDLAGFELGVDCTEDGLLYLRWYTNGGNFDLKAFLAPGGDAGDEVFRVVNVAAGATGTIAAQNGHTVSGTVTFGAAISADTTDRHRLRLLPDFALQAAAVWDGSIDDDASSLEQFTNALSAIVNACGQARNAIRSTYDRFYIAAPPKNPIGRGNDFLKASERIVYGEDAGSDTADGNVTKVAIGLLERERLSMRDETTGSEQTVLRRAVSAGSAVYGSNNEGLFAPGAIVVGERCPEGRLVLFVSKGVDDKALGQEELDGYFAVSEAGAEEQVPVSGVRVNRIWTGPYGINFTLARMLSKVSDGSHVSFAAASYASSTGERNTPGSENTDAGNIYGLCQSNGSGAWNYSFFSSSQRTADSLVAKATGVATGAAFTAVPQNNSGLTINWKAGSGPSNGATCTLQLNPLKRRNAAGERDTVEIPFTLAAGAGLIQTRVARFLKGELNSASSSPTIDDKLLIGGTFPPFVSPRDQ